MKTFGIYLILQSSLILFRGLGYIDFPWKWVLSLTWIPLYILVMSVGFGCLFYKPNKEEWEE